MLKFVSLFILASVIVASAQRPAVDIVSIRPVVDVRPSLSFSGGYLYVRNYPLGRLVTDAYGPVEWPKGQIHSTRVSLDARLTVNRALVDAERREVLRELLTSHFGLKTHTEQGRVVIDAVRMPTPN